MPYNHSPTPTIGRTVAAYPNRQPVFLWRSVSRAFILDPTLSSRRRLNVCLATSGVLNDHILGYDGPWADFARPLHEKNTLARVTAQTPSAPAGMCGDRDSGNAGVAVRDREWRGDDRQRGPDHHRKWRQHARP